MRILVADDDMISRKILETMLEKSGYETISANDGREAEKVLYGENPPKLAILDWMMPHKDGIDVCRQLREKESNDPTYVIILTAKAGKKDIIEGLEAGANDYITKPFDKEELIARVDVGYRFVNLQQELANKIEELENAITHIQTLQGILPICSYCKSIRNDKDYWEKVEDYVGKYSSIKFSHSICPDCYEKHIESQMPDPNSEK